MASSYGNAMPSVRNHISQNYSGGQAVGQNLTAVNPNNAKFPMIELHVSANNLTDMDLITVSDPICVLFVNDGNKWVEFGRTEVIWNNLNPEWVKFFTVQYVFEIRQPLLFRVYDVDSDTATLSNQDFIGEAYTELSQIVSSTGTTELDLHLPGKEQFRGKLKITPEQVEGSASVVECKIKAENLKSLHWLGGNSPFFVIAKSSEGGNFLPIYQSSVNKKMRWSSFTVPFQQLCNCDPERPLRISFMDYRRTSHAVLIGYADTTYSRLSEMLMQPIEIRDKDNKPAGKFTCMEMQLQQKFSFYDFLRGGVQLNLITAIDFTASNRDPRDPRSLHFCSVDGINQYESCIRAVGEILCPYDTDQMFPVYGFGAKLGGIVNHCFPLTFNPSAPCVNGLAGIIGAYRNALTQIQFSGPTLFSHIINSASRVAQESWAESRTYTILLIITDGIINDMQDTKDAIVAAGRLPLSIIIVGVGNANFDAMDELDADDVPLVSRAGYKMERDLVQFVPYNQFRNKHYTALAAEVLDEIPRQVVEWAELCGVKPNVAV